MSQTDTTQWPSTSFTGGLQRLGLADAATSGQCVFIADRVCVVNDVVVMATGMASGDNFTLSIRKIPSGTDVATNAGTALGSITVGGAGAAGVSADDVSNFITFTSTENDRRLARGDRVFAFLDIGSGDSLGTTTTVGENVYCQVTLRSWHAG